jgi:bifunctional UDP-N-acetylglucosamine pyrophosphorylase/glucosamine-1-phosphate N-acetyltransferase
MSTVAAILAAGLGKCMNSDLPHVLHPILGDPALLWVLRALPKSVSAAVVVVKDGQRPVEEAVDHWTRQGLLPCATTIVNQGEPRGTGHALQMAGLELDRLGATRILILSGWVPLLDQATIQDLATSSAMLLAMDVDDPTRYRRITQNPDGSLATLVNDQDSSNAIQSPHRVDGGAYCMPWNVLKPALAEQHHASDQDEHHLIDAVATVAKQLPIAVKVCPLDELTGMHSRLDQAVLQSNARDRINRRWMEAGVTFLDPASTFVGPRVTLAKDVLLEPGTRIEGTVSIGEGTCIGQGCVIRECVIGQDVEIRPYCVLHQAKLAKGAKLGPFAHLREGSILHENVHVGNFVETKKAILHTGVKANHLSYLGDTEVGERTNIGAGFISCNYDGFNKHRTVIGKDVFVGSDCQLVAPVTLGDGSIIGAGSTITRDIPADALALTRAPLVLREDAAGRLREKLRSKKNQS